ncbi:hypothetical protein N7457_005677 [Penicillium paradoxum]|uniref:uncharacterized protein n=1 Tax=Penicillium paradoxum TaxID=176176 RepID=UPI002546EF3D|nr:uncharacterized protein N7457_005677 [Penicillium paradoxum]KAJ5780517.1 hypothetical protein N7457_005677 [Penicillium paradoxum]
MIEPENQNSQLADCDLIPIIDLSNLESPHLHERQNLAQSIYDACTQVGFFYIKNHGIPEDMIKSIHSAAKRLFDLPAEQKMRFYIANSQKFRGYSPLGGEKSTGTEDDPVDEEDAVSALSEAFDIGYETAMDLHKSKNDPLPRDTYGLYGDNQWPSHDLLPNFSDIYIRYCAMMLSLCRKLMRIFALALDLPEGYFDSMVQNPGVTSRMMHYPPQPVKQEIREGLGAHTVTTWQNLQMKVSKTDSPLLQDFECFTILSQDSVPGLQVLNHSGEWMLAPPLPGTLVVNIADCLSIWTNKKFKSTIHRVTNLTGHERYSIPFFFGVDYDTTVSVLPNFISDDNPACKEPFKAGEWVREKLSKAYVGYQG